MNFLSMNANDNVKLHCNSDNLDINFDEKKKKNNDLHYSFC